MSRLSRIVMMGAVLTGTLMVPTPARAGGWAATVVDPVPGRLAAGHTYTIGYWVLQHGTHPYGGEHGDYGGLGTTGLKLVGADGRAVFFKGVPLREPAHYATAIALPKGGNYTVYGVQGVFGEDKIGTLALPGRFEVAPRPAPESTESADGGYRHHQWGLIRPPYLVGRPAADGSGRVGIPADRASAAQAPAAPTAGRSAPPPQRSAAALPLVIAISLFGGLTGAWVLLRRRFQTEGVHRGDSGRPTG